MLRLLVALALWLAPAQAFAADGDLLGQCRLQGLWRMCEVLMCDANNGASDCADVDLGSKLLGLGYPEHAVFEVVSDGCATDAMYEIGGLSSLAGTEHLYPECSGAGNKIALTGANTRTSCYLPDPRHRFLRAAIQTNGVTCGTVRILGRFWIRLR